MLDGLIIKVLEFLRSRIDSATANCRYRKALDDALDMVGLEETQKASVDLLQPVETWPLNIRTTITTRLSAQYSDFLNIRVGNEDNDFLVRKGIDVVSTYADPTVPPDSEHLCLAALMLEGVVTDIASANWDGLIEAAYAELTGGEDGLAVCVTSQQLQDQGARPKLIKFHGCAVNAKNDPQHFTDLIVARSAQIANWGSSLRTAAIKDYLKGLIGQKRTLMLGLSAQDFNIQNLFREARDTLSWIWDQDAPAYLFSEDKLGAKQDDLLENVYRNQYNGAQRANIKDGSVIRAFAKSLLLALLLQVYAEKLKLIAGRAVNLGGDTAKDWIADGIRAARDHVASEQPADKAENAEFAKAILSDLSRIRRLIVSGIPDNAHAPYRPIMRATADQIDADPEIEDSGLPEAAVALSILGQGHRNDAWQLNRGDPVNGQRASAVVEKSGTSMPIYVAANAGVAHRLFADGVIDDQTEAILIHSESVPERLQRNPGKRGFGRSGAPRLQEVSVKDLLAHGPASDELFLRFRIATTL